MLVGDDMYSCPIDVWSVGCVFADMVTERPLFRGDSRNDQREKIAHLLGSPSSKHILKFTKSPFPKDKPGSGLETVVKNLEPTGMDLLRRMLTFDPFERITASEAIDHMYFSS